MKINVRNRGKNYPLLYNITLRTSKKSIEIFRFPNQFVTDCFSRKIFLRRSRHKKSAAVVTIQGNFVTLYQQKLRYSWNIAMIRQQLVLLLFLLYFTSL